MCLKYNVAGALIVLVLAATIGGTTYFDYSEEDRDYSKEFENYDGDYYEYGNSQGFLNQDGSLRQSFAVDAALSHQNKSFVCSPISASIPLGMLALGAEGVCLEQLLKAIGVKSRSKLKKAFSPLIKRLEHLPGVTLNIISKIYVSNDVRLRSKFRMRANGIFNSAVANADFKNPDETAKLINTWVSQKTDSSIPEIISANEISPSISMIVINAVYFGGLWAKTFEKVFADNFYTPLGTKNISMMTVQGEYKYAKSDDLDSQLVEIPYHGDKASLIIILPNSKDGLPVLLDKFKSVQNLTQFDTALNEMKMTELVLTIPKFKIEAEVDLKVSYEKLGVTEIFQTEKSGLEKVVRGDKNMYVSKAIQKAIIEVSELGTMAAADSISHIATISLKQQFIANHPFMFFINYKKELIFFGLFTNS